jgi:putative tricarboxylic transport membrane protein
VLLVLINLPLAPAWAKLLQIPRPYLYAGIIFFATLGAFAVNLQWFDLAILTVLGLLGFAMRRFGIPVLPLILGVIIGPRAEEQLRKSLQLSHGEVSGLFDEPVAITVYVIIALVLLAPIVRALVPSARTGGGLGPRIAATGPGDNNDPVNRLGDPFDAADQADQPDETTKERLR